MHCIHKQSQWSFGSMGHNMTLLVCMLLGINLQVQMAHSQENRAQLEACKSLQYFMSMIYDDAKERKFLLKNFRWF